MEDQEYECTALGNEADHANVLMIAPCSCPRCAPEPIELIDDSEKWLRVSGQRQRQRVEPMTLGARGQALLG